MTDRDDRRHPADALTAAAGADAGPGAAIPEGGQAVRQDAAWRMILRAFAENRLALAGLILVALVALFCFAGPLFWHTDQVHTNLLQVNQPPSAEHPLGTTDLGYDVLGRLMVGGQSSLLVGVAVALVATGFGVLYGVISGYFGGPTDAVLMRIVDIVLAVPVVYLFIDLASEFKPTLLLLILVLSLLSWLGRPAWSGARRSACGSGSTWRRSGPWAAGPAGSSSATSCRTPWGRSRSTRRSRSPTRS